jgi:multidrug efflux pump subunit AcrA (membrane-fusion protein)
MTRPRTIALAAAVVIAAAIAWWLVARNRPAPEAAARPQVPVATVRAGTLERTLHLTGRAGPVAGTQSKLAFSIAGTVRSVDVRLGERVAAGEPLAQLDATPYAYAAQAAHADAAAAAGSAALAAVDRTSVKLRVDEADLQRQRRLYAAGIVAQRDVAAAEAVVAADRAESQSARDQVAAARAQSASAAARAGSSDYDLARTTLRAPSGGVVSGIYVQPGESVDASTAVIAIASSDAHTATLDVAVSDVARLAPGDLVRAKAGEAAWEGRIAGVATAVDQNTGLAVATVAGVPGDVAAGTPVEADVVTGHASGLAIPVAAVVEDPQSGDKLVFVQGRDKDGNITFASRTVTLGVRSGDSVIVTSGLKPGERVASQGAIELLAPPSSGGD